MACDTWLISAPVSSQITDSEFMELIFCAKKALVASLASFVV